jgi:tetratricopeptide (TPR) repeat protein
VRDAEGALQAGQLDDAVRAARDAAAGASSAVTQNLLGRALLARFQRAHRAEDAEGARAAFLRAVELDARFWPALENLGALAELGGHPDEAATFYRRVLEAEPQHPQRARFEALFAQLPPPSR